VALTAGGGAHGMRARRLMGNEIRHDGLLAVAERAGADACRSSENEDGAQGHHRRTSSEHVVSFPIRGRAVGHLLDGDRRRSYLLPPGVCWTAAFAGIRPAAFRVSEGHERLQVAVDIDVTRVAALSRL